MLTKAYKKYTLSDTTIVDVLWVSKKVGCSKSLARSRLNTSTDPEYIYMTKGKRIEGGHLYYNALKKRKEEPPKKKLIKHYAEGDLKHLFDPMFRLAMKVI